MEESINVKVFERKLLREIYGPVFGLTKMYGGAGLMPSCTTCIRMLMWSNSLELAVLNGSGQCNKNVSKNRTASKLRLRSMILQEGDGFKT